MRNSGFIKIINYAFQGVARRKENKTFVKRFDFKKPQSLMFPGGIHQAEFASIFLDNEYGKNSIKILYRNDRHELLPFSTAEEQNIAVECLRRNNILPTPQEFFNAQALSDDIKAIYSVGGDEVEDAITEHAKAFLEKTP